jgi:hypothetical protein
MEDIGKFCEEVSMKTYEYEIDTTEKAINDRDKAFIEYCFDLNGFKVLIHNII